MVKKKPALLSILLGIVCSHLFFTGYVYLSNMRLYHQTIGLLSEGYLVVPNLHVLPSLQAFFPAFMGGFFFTMTIGLTLSGLSYFSAILWKGPFRRNKLFLRWLVLLILFCVVLINRNGRNILFSVWFVGTFWLVFKCTLSWQPPTSGHLSSRLLKWHIPVLLIVVAAWAMPSGNDIFITIRDKALFPNAIGRTLIDVYYRYTLYPAEAIKSLDQKLFTTCRLQKFQTKRRYNKISKRLLGYHFLPVTALLPEDISVWEKGETIYFTVNGHVVRKCHIEDFMKNSGKYLSELSRRSDRHQFARHFIAFSLLAGVPLLSYVAIFWMCYCFMAIFSKKASAYKIASIACFFFPLTFLSAAYFLTPPLLSPQEISGAMDSQDWRVRTDAYRSIAENRLEIMDYVDTNRLLSESHPLERIWAAKSLTGSRSSKADTLLWRLVNDSQANVVCMALRSIGQRGNRKLVPQLVDWMENSTHWYTQWYAYQALKTLRWKQLKSS